MPPPEPERMDLRTWHELCRQQDEERAAAESQVRERQRMEELSPTAQQLSPPQRRVLRRWANISGLALIYTLLGGWLGTLLFGLLWLPGLPSALLSYTYRPIPAQITIFEPQSCARQVGGTPARGIHYTYSYEGHEYTSSRVLPFPLSNDYLDNCGQPLWASLQQGKADLKTGHLLTTAYVNPLIPTQAVLRRGVPISLPGLWGLFSLMCVVLGVWGILVHSSMETRGHGSDSAKTPPFA